MSDLIFVTVSNIVLGLTRDEFEIARTRGLEFTQQPEPKPVEQRLLSAEQMESATGVPSSWWGTQARQKRIPHIRLGHYVRFNLDECVECAVVQVRLETTKTTPLAPVRAAPVPEHLTSHQKASRKPLKAKTL